LRTVFDLIIKMSLLNESFYEIALKEFYARKKFKAKLSELHADDDAVSGLLVFKL
jgi:hypothetical protein